VDREIDVGFLMFVALGWVLMVAATLLSVIFMTWMD
jgi:hypothetical protein